MSNVRVTTTTTTNSSNITSSVDVTTTTRTAHETTSSVPTNTEETVAFIGESDDYDATSLSVEDGAANLGPQSKWGHWTKVRLLDFNCLPSWLQDNNFILSRYRPQIKSFKLCFRSIFSFHTETVNIWTHLLGWLAFCAFIVYAYIQPLSSLTWRDRGIFAVFLLGAFCCLLFSWVFHCFQCHSPSVFRVCINFDYAGVSMLIMSSFIAWVYYAFYCQRTLRIVYALTMVAFGALCIAVSLIKKFASPSYRPVRAILFLSLGLYGIVPLIHCIAVFGGFTASSRFSSAGTGPLMAMGMVYIIGLGLYTFRIPERFWPGKFDVWCHSHQLFHVCVVIGVFMHATDILRMAAAHVQTGCP